MATVYLIRLAKFPFPTSLKIMKLPFEFDFEAPKAHSSIIKVIHMAPGCQ